MKTTIDIPGPLFQRLRERAVRERTTIRAVVQRALTRYLSPRKAPRSGYRLEDGSFEGTGLAPGVEEGNWSQIRPIIYEGRGD